MHRDLVTFGPYVGRSILESALTAILLRFDPFRSRSLDRFAKHPRYDANDAFKHRIQWSGDIYPSDAPPQDVWNPELKAQSVSRALFSAHTIDAAWVPAAEAMLDFISRSGHLTDLGFFQSQTPQIALNRYQGEIKQLYSFLSKGVHGEFFLSQLSPLDAETCLEKLTTVIDFVAQTIELPDLSEDADLRILDLEIEMLEKSDTYPYGLTKNKLEKLREAGFLTIGQLADASDAELLRIDTIGTKSLGRIKDVVYQAIWM